MGRPSRYIDTDVDRFFKSDKIKVLDLCCCSGLSAEGILRHPNVSILGIDNKKPSYYPGTFMLTDATKLDLTFVQLFNFVWGSPPCQWRSRGAEYARRQGKQYINILDEVRALITASGKPGVIENIPEAQVRPDFMLCGSMFGLPQMRHRHFECINWVPRYKKLYCDHTINKGNNHVIAGSFRGTIHDAAISMDCYPTRLRSELKEGIPPAYSQFIFKVFLTTVPDFNIVPVL
jgi:DNA (cytosine-5)-methyltransferase 1